MNRPPSEVVVATLAFTAFWVVLASLLLIPARDRPRRRVFQDRMRLQSRDALGIAGVFALGMGLAGRGWLNPVTLGIFAQALVGLALARGISGFEPLPVARAIADRRGAFRQLVQLVPFAILAAMTGLLLGALGIGFLRSLTGEPDPGRAFATAANGIPDPTTTFLAMLAGAGIAEETTFRLAALSALWSWTNRPRTAILISAILFGAYHLTPLSGMYRVFWNFPVSQFAGSSLVGVVWGYVYVKRGYETVVLAHTLSNWIPIVLLNAD